MRRIIHILVRSALVRSQRGATAVEYALILAMVVLAMITALTNVANKTTGMWGNVSNEVLAR
ncbi:pilus assembly protein Flp/PilA [Sphingobium sp. OAS761]|uniref:Flp family type IVb pilin n=1 Tax=Sphingobium sp. OAS761 TaxID=2817901 RepID=UPI00209EB0BE|nr:Flp family type IVb pilin [Sphingobium sp. OAS761]MCP1470627.1 pilus assembly protein Flp/PilA [Sphingobium sp. OAS761]